MRTASWKIAVAVVLISACSGDPTAAVSSESPAFREVVPANGVTGVDPTRPITITFTHPMMQGMESLVVLHEGSVTGPVVSATSSWSVDQRSLTVTPAAPLKAGMLYVLHLAPDLRDASGTLLDHAQCAGLGGQNVTGGMMMGGGMMGSGWQSVNSSYGMIFTFTTR